MASERNEFDEQLQVAVTFPNVFPSSILHLKYKIVTLKQPLPNYFASTFMVGRGLMHHYQVTIRSALPLYLVVNDPRQILNVENKLNGKEQILSIRLKEKAIAYEELTNEPQSSFLKPEDCTYVMVSTVEKNEEFAKVNALNFEPVIGQPLPPLFMRIKEEAEKSSALIERLNVITSRLGEAVRYLSDLKTIEGRFAPRALQVTAESAVGDCKDYSAATVAILRNLGYKANIVLVMRGVGYLAPQKLLPAVHNNNHAMVKVTDRDSKVLWIDPTNVVSMAGGIFPDISYRQAFVLDPENPSYESIPEINPSHAKTTSESEITIEGNIQHIKGTTLLEGEETLMIAASELYSSSESIKEGIIRLVSGEATPLNPIVQLPDLKARIVPEKGLTINYSYSQANKFLRTNSGMGLRIDSSWGDVYARAADDQVGMMYVGNPSLSKNKKIIKNKILANMALLDFKIETPWVSAARKCSLKGNDTIIEEKVLILKNFISAEEVKSPEFKKLKELIKGFCQDVAVILPVS